MFEFEIEADKRTEPQQAGAALGGGIANAGQNATGPKRPFNPEWDYTLGMPRIESAALAAKLAEEQLHAKLKTPRLWEEQVGLLGNVATLGNPPQNNMALHPPHEDTSAAEPAEPSIPSSTAFAVLGALLAVILVLAVTAFYFANRADPPVAVDPLRAAQAADLAEATKTNQVAAQAQLDRQEKTTEMEMRVANACIDRGGVPIYFNGNVDCKLLPK